MKIFKVGESSVCSIKQIKDTYKVLSKSSDSSIVVIEADSVLIDQLTEIGELSILGKHSEKIELLRDQFIDRIKKLIALKDQSDLLIHIQKQFTTLSAICDGIFTLNELSGRTKAKILSIGERLISYLLLRYYNQEGGNYSYVESTSYMTAFGDNYLDGVVNRKLSEANILESFTPEGNYITSGSFGSDINGNQIGLGKGGAQVTSSYLANIMEANSIELLCDHDGIMSGDPDYVQGRDLVRNLTYQEMFELVHFGVDIIYPPAVRMAMVKDIPIVVKSTLYPDDIGTVICNKIPEKSGSAVKGVSAMNGVSLIAISGVGLAGIKGSARRVFQAVEDVDVNIIMISQCCSEHSICMAVDHSRGDDVVRSLSEQFKIEIEADLVDPILHSEELSVVAVVGDGMRSLPGISSKVCSILADNNINVRTIAQGVSERNISLVISKNDIGLAVKKLHKHFFN